MSARRNVLAGTVVLMLLCGCHSESVVSYETIQSFRPAQGSIAVGYSSAALDAATRLSEVRSKCGTPLGEWQEQIPFFTPQIKKLKYKTYDTHHNVLTTTFAFVMTSSDPSLIGIKYDQTSN